MIRVTQLKNGIQPRPYADHVWEWEIFTDQSEEEVLAYCRKNLRNAARDEKTYWTDYRDRSKSFDEHMEVVCGGFFQLTKYEGKYVYRVTKEYID